MVIVDELKIVNNGLSLHIKAHTTVAGDSIEYLWIYDSTNYKLLFLEGGYDISYKCAQTSEYEDFLVQASDLGIDRFEGIILLEVGEGYSNVYSTSNLSKINTCILNNFLNLDICNKEELFKCLKCDSTESTVVNIGMLKQAIIAALENGRVKEAFELYNTAIKLCTVTKNNCNECNK